MAVGDVTASEATTFVDHTTGGTVRQLTAYLTHSHHRYFTNSGLWDGDRRVVRGDDGQIRIVCTADPQGYGNVYMVDVPDFESLPQPD